MTTSLETFAESLLELLAVAPAQCKPGSVLQHHHIFAVEPRLHFLDAVGVDDARTMDADETLGIQARFHVVHRLAEEMGFFAEVEPHVIAGGLDPIDLLCAQEKYASTRLDDETIETLRLGLDVLDQRHQALAEIAGASPLEMLAGMLQRLRKAIAAEWLQQVIDRVHFKSFQRVLVVRRDEHDGGDLFGPELLDHAEAVTRRHLDIEEHEIGMLLL